MQLGFIGTGTIAEAFIIGLAHAGTLNPVIVSPRSETVGARLAERFTHVTRAAANADVANASDIVFLGMRPAQLEAALAGVHFTAHQIVVSFVSGLSLAELGELAQGAKVCRVLPLPMIARGEGPVICAPPLSLVIGMLKGMGEVVATENEEDLKTLGAVSAFMSSYFELQKTMIGSLTANAIAPATASVYVRSLFAALGGTGLQARPEDQAALVGEHETKGGLNQKVREHLTAANWFNEPLAAFATLNSLSRDKLA